MKKTIKFLAAMLVLSLLFITACGNSETSGNEGGSGDSGSDAEPTIIRFGSGATGDSPTGKGMEKFKEILEEKSEGRYVVELYPASQLGDDLKMIDALKAGTLEMSTPTTAPVTGTSPEFGIFDLPFIVKNYETADAVLNSEVGQTLVDTLPEHGLVGLAWWEYGFRSLTSDKQAVEKVEDFKGQKVRTQQNSIHIDFFNALGANATPLAYSEVFSALENGTIDAQENPVGAIEDNKYNEVQDYLSLTEHLYSPIIILMSKKFWDGLSEEDQKLIQEAAAEAGDYQIKLNREQAENSITNLENAGMKVNEFSEEEKAKALEIVQPVIEKHKADIGEELVDQFLEMAK
jgi:TRAP-type transport system periplasmic protein